LDADSVQVFTQSPRAWRPTNHDPASFERFRAKRAEAGIGGVLCHALYLCNLAAPDDTVYEKSVAAMRNTMEVGCAIGADGVVFHVGSHLGSGFEAGLERVVPALEQVLELCSDETWLLMENSAGAGGTIGRSIEELATIHERLGGHPRLGVCLDQLDSAVGLDRHANILEGELGEKLGVFLSSARLQGLPAVLETAGPENRGPDANEIRKTKELRARWLA